jgi:hypothetical protein
MTIRVKNLSNADQELAPGSGFIPANGSRDYPDAEYRDQHEKYAKTRLEADPPIFEVSTTSDEPTNPDPADKAAQKQTEQNADDARKAEELLRAEQYRAPTESTRRHR